MAQTTKSVIAGLLVACVAASGPTRKVQSPKAAAASGKLAVMVLPAAPTAPPSPSAVKPAFVVVRPPPRAPWRLSASFSFTPPFGAVSTKIYVTQGATGTNYTFPATNLLGTVSVLTATNMNPFRPYFFRFTSIWPDGQETPLVSAATTALLGVSPVSWQDAQGQHFAMTGANHVITVEAESTVNGAKSTVGIWTNQPVISITRPVKADEFYIFTAR